MSNTRGETVRPAVPFPALLALLCALALCAVMLVSYAASARDLKALTEQFDAATARWKQIDSEKQVLLEELEEIQTELYDAEDDIASAERRVQSIEQYRTDIEELERQIAELTAP